MNSFEIAKMLNQQLEDKFPNPVNSCIGCHFEAFDEDEITATIFLSNPFFRQTTNLEERLQLAEKYIESKFKDSMWIIERDLLRGLGNWIESDISLDHDGVYLFLWSGDISSDSFKEDTLLFMSRIIMYIEEGSS
jgi:hypothetical protein